MRTSPDPLDRRADRAGRAARTARRTRLADRVADRSRDDQRRAERAAAAVAPAPAHLGPRLRRPERRPRRRAAGTAPPPASAAAARAPTTTGATGTATGDVLNGRPDVGQVRRGVGPGGRADARRARLAYFTMPSRGLPHEQDRCIGVATAPDLSVHLHRARQQAARVPRLLHDAARPSTRSPDASACPRRGVIDPSSYIAPDGRRFLLYRTQGTPSTIRMIRLNAAGTGDLRPQPRADPRRGVLENPVMVTARRVALPDHLARRLRRLPLPHDLAPLEVPPPGLAGHPRPRAAQPAEHRRLRPGRRRLRARRPTTARQPDVLPRLGLQGHQPALLPALPGRTRTTRTSASARCTPSGWPWTQGRPVDLRVRAGAGAAAPTETPTPTPTPDAHRDADADADRDADRPRRLHGPTPTEPTTPPPRSRPGLPTRSRPATGHSDQPRHVPAARKRPLSARQRHAVPARRPVSRDRAARARRQGRGPAGRCRSGSRRCARRSSAA